MALKGDKERAVEELTAKTKALAARLTALKQEHGVEQKEYRELIDEANRLDRSIQSRVKQITDFETLLSRAEAELFEERTILSGL